MGLARFWVFLGNPSERRGFGGLFDRFGRWGSWVLRFLCAPAMEEGGSDGENQGRSPGKAGNSGEGQSKPKRQMKTPFQLETLEKAYASACLICFVSELSCFSPGLCCKVFSV